MSLDQYAGLSSAEVQKLAKQADVNQPVMSVKVVGGRVELHLLGGTVIPVQSASQSHPKLITSQPSAKTPTGTGASQAEAILETLTVSQMRDLAAEARLTGYSKANRAALIVMLSEHYTAEELRKLTLS